MISFTKGRNQGFVKGRQQETTWGTEVPSGVQGQSPSGGMGQSPQKPETNVHDEGERKWPIPLWQRPLP